MLYWRGKINQITMASIARYERFDNDGIELIIDMKTGESYATISGYSRMSGLSQPAISQRISRAKGVRDDQLKTADINTPGGNQVSTLMPIRVATEELLRDYHKNPTQGIFNTLKALYKHQGLDTEGLVNLHNFNKGNKSNLKGSDREKQIQLAYQLRYGGEIEYPTANGRIDLLTDDTIYEFKIFRDYKNCLGQLLAYDDCIPQKSLKAVLFGVPKALRFNGPECKRVEALLNKYGIDVKFLR